MKLTTTRISLLGIYAGVKSYLLLLRGYGEIIIIIIESTNNTRRRYTIVVFEWTGVTLPKLC